MSAYAVMWSGGKDSALALWRARQRGLEIRWLLTVYDAATRRVRFHATPIAAIAAQARAAALELVAVPTTWEGFDLALTRAVADAVDVPVIASGGVGKLDHLAEGVLEGRADAVLAASIFHFGEFTVRAAKEHLAKRGIEVRL